MSALRIFLGDAVFKQYVLLIINEHLEILELYYVYAALMYTYTLGAVYKIILRRDNSTVAGVGRNTYTQE